MKEFESNVTQEKWFKHTTKPWKKVINQTGIVLEDEIHEGKIKGCVKAKKVLKKGTRVIIDDIRGRIKPQYMVTDPQGKIWFVSALNIEVEQNEERLPELDKYQYRGGVRHDGKELNPRYSVETSTEEEYNERLEKNKN